MKRFFCALVVLIITITSAVLLTYKLNKTADEIINYIELNGNENIMNCWENNKIIFSVLLDQKKTESLRKSFYYAEKHISNDDALSEIIDEMKEIKNSSKLCFENIF